VADEESLERLRAENQELRRQLREALEQIATLRKLIAELQQRIAELEHQDKPPPPFVKPSRPQSTAPKLPRRKRSAQHNHARRREPPTQSEEHALERCPQCQGRLHGQNVDYVRQVIELPPPPTVEVIEHRVLKRYCPHCERWQSPKLDLKGQVLGQGRVGVRLTSLIVYLRQSLRLPIRRIQEYLQIIHQLRISTGEIVELLHRVRGATQEVVEALKQEAQGSLVLQADETGWRENGQNGYIWAFSTSGEKAVRYYEFDKSRGQVVVRRLLGDKFQGHLVSDFYCGYNEYPGEHQRCWVHFLRDLHELKSEHSQEKAVLEWAQAVRDLYEEGQKWLEQARSPSQGEREAKYVELVSRVHALGLEYASLKHPCQALCKRILRHEDELFQYVLVAGVPADNNLAERSIRPLVVIRKISGGSRSREGTQTRMALASLLGTWQARGWNPFTECFKLLSAKSSTPV
jgi:transposase